MMKFLTVSGCLLLLGVGCASTTVQTPESADAVQEAVQEPTQETAETALYVSFIQNVHDWVFPENSLETVERLIELHERYGVPVEFYLNDQVVQSYLELDPSIFGRLADSDMVAVSYHIRPPHPVYEGFDTIGLEDMNQEEQYETLYAYETHRLDLATGAYTDEPGGYAYLKQLLGYTPRVVTHTNSRAFGEALSQVYEELGAQFAVIHGKEISLGERVRGLWTRPETVEVKLYEESYRRGFGVEERFEEWTAGFDGSRDFFLNLKYHENNFYTEGTPFGLVYWAQVGGGKKEEPKSPPYDLTAGDDTEFKTQEEQAEKWQIYEETLRYVAEHPDELTAITSADLEEMLDE